MKTSVRERKKKMIHTEKSGSHTHTHTHIHANTEKGVPLCFPIWLSILSLLIGSIGHHILSSTRSLSFLSVIFFSLISFLFISAPKVFLAGFAIRYVNLCVLA
ncbi:hypothetical protein BKA57DRAFT_463560 [Linnemannia elongata]|nr:hypothetical protein BKA57DRAFT_463560 [Linnemannia elongata]